MAALVPLTPSRPESRRFDTLGIEPYTRPSHSPRGARARLVSPPPSEPSLPAHGLYVVDVSVLIVSWNSRDLLRRCLRSLESTPVDVIVVDNGSTDASADLVSREFPTVRLVREPTNRGFAAAVNRGRRDAERQFVLLLNSDTEVSPGSIERLAGFLQTHDDYGAAGGRLVDDSGEPQRGFNVRRFPTLASIAVDLLLVDKVWPATPVTRRYLALDLDASRTQPVEQPAAACLLVRRDLLDALDGLDERFHPAWFEDVDLGRRIAAAGWRIAYVADADFLHRGGIAMGALGLHAFARIWYRNLRRYVAKHHDPPAHFVVMALIAAGMTLRVFVCLATGRPRRASAYVGVLADLWPGRLRGPDPPAPPDPRSLDS